MFKSLGFSVQQITVQIPALTPYCSSDIISILNSPSIYSISIRDHCGILKSHATQYTYIPPAQLPHKIYSYHYTQCNFYSYCSLVLHNIEISITFINISLHNKEKFKYRITLDNMHTKCTWI